MTISDVCQCCGKHIAPLPVEHAFCTRCRYAQRGAPKQPDKPTEYEVALETTAAPECAPEESAQPTSETFVADALAVLVNSKPRRDQWGPLITGLACMLRLPGCGTITEAQQTTGISDSAISRAQAKLQAMIRAEAALYEIGFPKKWE
jgi:hypothetical protein